MYDNKQISHYGENCTFTIISEDPSKHVMATITSMSLVSCYEEEDMYSVVIYNGQTDNAPILGKYCGRKIPRLISGGSALHIVIMTGTSKFFLTYSVLESDCGAVLFSETGEFSSPGYPLTYRPNMRCEWTIQVSPGYEMILQFHDMDILDSEKCNGDYVEVRKVNSSGDLIGFYCGNRLPPAIKNKGDIWVMFESSTFDGGAGRGFLAEFILNRMNEISGSSGQIVSPLYPNCNLHSNEQYKWRIIVPTGNKIRLNFLDHFFDNFGSDEQCSYTLQFKIFDGYSPTASLLEMICGNDVTKTIQSSSNTIYIEYQAESHMCYKFLLEWQAISSARSNSKTNITCGSNSIIDVSNVTEYNFTSPGYPNGYNNSLECKWLFKTTRENHLDILFSSIDLDSSHISCWSDKISLYKGSEPEDLKLVSTVCDMDGVKDIGTPYENHLQVIFNSDNYGNFGNGFSAKIQNCM